MAHFCLKCGLQILNGDRGNITIKADGFEHKECKKAVASKIPKPPKAPEKEEIKEQPSVMEIEEKKDEGESPYILKQTTDWIDGEDTDAGSEDSVGEAEKE